MASFPEASEDESDDGSGSAADDDEDDDDGLPSDDEMSTYIFSQGECILKDVVRILVSFLFFLFQIHYLLYIGLVTF